MSFVLNKEFIVIGDIENDNEILLKNISSNRVFKISPIEYRIITTFTENNSIRKTYEFFSKEFDISEGLITKIVSFAKEYDFINDKENEKDNKQNSKVYYSNKFFYIFISIFTFLRLDKLRLRIDMNSNFNLLKVVNWKVKNFSIAFYSTYRKLLYILIVLSLIALFFSLDKIDIPYIFYNIGQISPPFLLVILVLPISLVVSFLHEFSHFSVYKSFGGKQNEMGFALMYKILPIFFTATEDMILWKDRNKKISVALAGIINDLFFLFTLLAIHPYLNAGILNSLISFLIFSLIIKFLYNANPFAPGSDMYFVLSDLFNFQSPFLKVHVMFKSFFKKGIKVTFKWGLFFYGMLCYLSIFSYIITFLSLITLPFWINRII
jgi:hypothetical protein